MPKDSKKTLKLAADTRRRFDEQIREIEMVVQAAMLSAGKLEHERQDWTLDQLIPERPHAGRPIRSREFFGKLAALIAGAITVRATYATLFGVGEQIAAALNKIAEGTEALAMLANSGLSDAYLRNIGVIESACPLVGERAAPIGESVAVTLQAIDPIRTAQFARMGEQELSLRRAPAVAAGFYRGKGAGPRGQLILELWDLGFTPTEIAEYLLFRSLRRAGLTELERRTLIEDEAERIHDRLQDYRKVLQPQQRGITGSENPSPDIAWYLAMSFHVEPRSSLSICRGSREGVPGFYWHSSPLDPSGAPRELPPWETASSPA